MGRSSHSLSFNIVPTKVERDFFKEILYSPYMLSGMGKINSTIATTKLISEKEESIVLLGFCGGLMNTSLGDVIVPSLIVQKDFDAGNLYTMPEIKLEGKPNHIMYSQDRFATGTQHILRDDFDICRYAIDMESYAVAYTCQQFKVKCKVIKVVSDLVGSNSTQDFKDFPKRIGKVKHKRILEQVRSLL